jgi:hypothetical protein
MQFMTDIPGAFGGFGNDTCSGLGIMSLAVSISQSGVMRFD